MEKYRNRLLSFALAFITICSLALPASAGINSNYVLTGNKVDDIITVSRAQINKTKSDFGWTVDWCAYFVCWAGRTVGANFPSSNLGTPKDIARWFANNNAGTFYYFRDENYKSLQDKDINDKLCVKANRDSFTPQKGDLVVYLWSTAEKGINWSHIGIVEKYSGGKLYTVEGNTSGGKVAARERSYDSQVVGIIRPNYSISLPPPVSVTTNESGRWVVSIPANLKILLYSTNTASIADSQNWLSAKNTPYTIICTQKAVLSNGTTRFCAKFTEKSSGNVISRWFDFVSGMKEEQTPLPAGDSKSYIVTLNANGGSVSTSTITVKNGSTYGALPTPTRSGYSFDGWYTSSSGGTKITSSTTFNGTSNIILYAHWTATPHNVKITFDANGGSTSQSSKTIAAGTYLTGLPTATRSGYTFLGWTLGRVDPNSSATQSAMVVGEGTVSFDEDTTLYAYWRKDISSYIVTFNASGGSVSTSTKTVTSGSTYGTLPTPTRSGYSFDGWYTASSGGSKVTSSTIFNGSSNITLYAHWTATPTEKTVTITFDANGGSTKTASKTIAAGSYLTGLPTATRSGYTFLGWALDKIDPNASGTYTTVVVNDNMFSFSSDTTLYAYWRADQPTSTPPTSAKCTHTKGSFQYSMDAHPHYNYYSCSKCGQTFTDYSISADPSCNDCWGPWSGWSTTPAYASSTRQVETRSVQSSAGTTEYRYGRYIDSTGGHVAWCSTYLGSKGYSGITAQYSSWSATRYGATGKVWTCGYCNGNHTGIDHYDSQGRPAWNEYSLPSGSYFWEESRQTSGTTETQYRYRDLVTK